MTGRPPPLPDALVHAGFSVQNALSLGVSTSRLRASDLATPFHGTRLAQTGDVSIRQRCQALMTVLTEAQSLTGFSAALLWGMPLPRYARQDPLVHIASTAPVRAIRHQGVRATQRPTTWPQVVKVGLRVHTPVATWASLGGLLDLPDLIAVADFLLSGKRGRSPLAVRAELEAFVDAQSGMRGVRSLRSALMRAREGAWSRPESLLRLMIVDSGIPEPVLNQEVDLPSGRFVVPDISWPQYRVAVEYDGEHHRSATQHARDVTRIDDLRDAGYLTVTVMSSQLFSHPSALVARLMRALLSRGWRAPHHVTQFATFAP